MKRLALIAVILLTSCGGDIATPPETPSPLPASKAPAPTSVPSVDTGGPIALELVVDGINHPTSLADAGDGRMFVTEQGGLIRVIQDGALEQEPLRDLTDRVLNDGERGLLSIVIHPEFADNGRYFVVYSNLDTDTELREFNISDDADAEGSLLLEIRKDSVFHHGSSMLFGPDGYLYLSVGDDGRQGSDRAKPDNLYGTILRLDVDTTPGEITIPPDNPFANGGGRPEVWDYGLRNPWRMSLDQATGTLFIGDVGQNTAEEIDIHPAGVHGGLDFGWIATEGYECREDGCDTDGVTWPLAAYDHSNGDCGIIGGYVMQAGQPLAGRYLFGDLCSGRIWSLDPAETEPEPRLEVESGLRLSSFGIGKDGTLYALVHYTNGSIYRVTG